MTPKLIFSPYAWNKLLFLRDMADGDELAAFGIGSEENPLYITNLVMPEQETSSTSADFTEKGLQEYFEKSEETYGDPDRWCRVWIHTHPRGVKQPSGTDDDTWSQVFGHAPWAVMYILTECGSYYCKMRMRHSERITVDKDGNKSLDYYSIEQEIEAIVDSMSQWEKYHESWTKEFKERTVEPEDEWQNWKGQGNFSKGHLVDEEEERADVVGGIDLATAYTKWPDFEKHFDSKKDIEETSENLCLSLGMSSLAYKDAKAWIESIKEDVSEACADCYVNWLTDSQGKSMSFLEDTLTNEQIYNTLEIFWEHLQDYLIENCYGEMK